MTAESYLPAEGPPLAAVVAASTPTPVHPAMRNMPYPATIGQGDGPGGRAPPRAGQTGTLHTGVRVQQRAVQRSHSQPQYGSRSGPRHAAAREAAREQRMLEEYYAARRQQNQQRRGQVEAQMASWGASPGGPPGQPQSCPSSPAARARSLGTPEHQHKTVKKRYSKFDYSLRRDVPTVRRSSVTGTPMVSPGGGPAPHHTTPPVRRSSCSAALNVLNTVTPQSPGRSNLSPRRSRPQHPLSGRALWADLCQVSQFDFTCEELQVLHPNTLRGLAAHYGFSDELDLSTLLEHHMKVQRGDEPARSGITPDQARPGDGNLQDSQDTWVRQSQRPQKGYSHLTYGRRRNQPSVRRSSASGQPIVTRKQELEQQDRQRERRSAKRLGGGASV